MNLINDFAIHIQHGHLPILISALFRMVSLIPLLIVFISVTKTFINKLHYINGLRPYRVMMMAILGAAIADQLIFSYFDIKTFFSNASGVLLVESPFLLFNSIVTFLAYFFLYFLFRHASKRHIIDIFEPKGKAT